MLKPDDGRKGQFAQQPNEQDRPRWCETYLIAASIYSGSMIGIIKCEKKKKKKDIRVQPTS